MSAADSDIHRRSDYREVEYEDMTELEALNAIAEIIINFYKEDNERLEKENRQLSEDIQHVSYEPEQLGYGK